MINIFLGRIQKYLFAFCVFIGFKPFMGFKRKHHVQGGALHFAYLSGGPHKFLTVLMVVGLLEKM